MKPQLADTIKKPTKVLENPAWFVEEKFDGDRLLVRFEDRERPTLFSRKGIESTVPRVKTARITFDPLPKNRGVTIIDGEILPTGEYMVFDMTSFMGHDLQEMPYRDRRSLMSQTLPYWAQTGFNLVESVGVDKSEFVDRIREQNGEGVIFKHEDSTYHYGRRSDQWLKYKFWKSCSVIIQQMEREGKPEAVTIVVLDGDVEWEVSGCKIPSRYQEEQNIQEGDVIEVKYLTWTKDRQLIQPTFLRKRTDITRDDCTIGQFK